MMNRSFFLLFAGFLVCYSGSANALPNFISQSAIDTHIPTATIELKPVSFLDIDNSYQTAAVCFLGMGDCGNEGGFNKSNDDMGMDGNTLCLNEGFNISNCELPKYPDRQCPYNQHYYMACAENTARACRELGFVTSCSGTEIPDSSNVCQYNSNYFKCQCSPCDGYEYTLAQAEAEGYVSDGSCQSCEEIKYKRKCASCESYDYTYEQATAEGYEIDGSCQTCETTKYKRKNNLCEGYQACECGGEIGTQTCKSGTVTLYQNCKACCENKCSEDNCPAGKICEYETCSQKYCVTGCATNYTDWCTTPITDCGTLGYTKRISECVNGYLKCPYGDSVFCEDN